MASAVKDQVIETMVIAGGGWLDRTGCRKISVLDVVPISPEQIPGGAVSADIFF